MNAHHMSSSVISSSFPVSTSLHETQQTWQYSSFLIMVVHRCLHLPHNLSRSAWLVYGSIARPVKPSDCRSKVRRMLTQLLHSLPSAWAAGAAALTRREERL